MITREAYNRLNGLKGDDGHFVISAYLNVNPVTQPKGEYFVAFRNLVREELGRIPGGQKLLGEVIKKIETYLKGGKKEFKKSLVIFSSAHQNIWEVHHLSVPIRTQVVVDKSLYLKPLANLMEMYPSDLIVLVDREHARLFKVVQGEIQEYAELNSEDVPGKHRKGGWYGRDENRFRRRIELQVSLHLKDVIRETDAQLAGGDIGRVILGGTDDSLTTFRKMLSHATAAKIAGTFPAEIRATDDEVLSRASAVIRESEKVREDQWVEELLTRANKDGTAAVGLEDVISNLQAGKIHRVFYRADLRAEGLRCPKCGFLSVREMPSCPYCNVDLEGVDHLMDYIVQRALDQGAHLSALSENAKLQAVGSIGAILRY